MKKLFSFLMAMMILATACFGTMPVSATELDVDVGEGFTLESGDAESSEDREYNDEHTEEEVLSDASKHNQALNEWITSESIELVESWKETVPQQVVVTNNSVISVRETSVSLDIVENIINVGGGMWVEDGKYYRTGGWIYPYRPPVVEEETLNHLKGCIASPDIPALEYWEHEWYVPSREWIGWPEYVAELITIYREEEKIHDEIVPGYEVIDFPTFVERQRYILETLDFYHENECEEIELMYIVEYTVEDTSYSAIKKNEVIPLDNGDMYFWDLSCVEAPDDGFARENKTLTTKENTLSGSFAYEGVYRVVASQLVEQSICDAYTYNRCAYLVIKSTGQVIWKNEVLGPQIKEDKTLMEQNISYYFKTYNNVTSTSFVTTLDAIINVTETPGTPPPSVWDDDYFTERVE